MSSSPSPSSSHKRTPQGLADRKQSGPCSMSSLCWWCVAMLPPRRPLASSRTTSSGNPRAWAAWVRRYDAVRPVMPPPITTTRLRVLSIVLCLPYARTQALSQQLAQHREKRPMRAHRGRPPIRQTAGERRLARLDVKIVEHLDMVTEKPNRGNNHITIARNLHLLDGVMDVRLEPGEWCSRGLTLVRQTVVLTPQLLGHRRGGGSKLLGIGRPGRHGHRNGMRRINELGVVGAGRAEWLTHLTYRIGNRLDKAWMH